MTIIHIKSWLGDEIAHQHSVKAVNKRESEVEPSLMGFADRLQVVFSPGVCSIALQRATHI